VFAFLRDAGASVIMMSAAVVLERRKPAGQRVMMPAREDWGIFIGLGLLGVWGSQGLSALAIANTVRNVSDVGCRVVA
jgi:hypothetical protein